MVRRPLPSDHNKVGEGSRDTKEERSALTWEGARGLSLGGVMAGPKPSPLWILLGLEYSVKDWRLPSRVLDRLSVNRLGMDCSPTPPALKVGCWVTLWVAGTFPPKSL